MRYYSILDIVLFISCCVMGWAIRPTKDLRQLRYIYPLMMLMGYGASLLFEIVSGDRVKDLFLVSSQIIWVLRFSTLGMVLYWFGYYTSSRSTKGPDIEKTITPPMISPWLIVPCAVFVFLADIGEVGFDNLLRSSFSRSYGQFQETIPWTSFVTRLASALAYPLVATAGVAWVSSRRSLYLLVPALVSVVPVARFSRGMFIPAAVFVLTASIASPRKKHSVAIGVFAVCCVLGFIMGARLRHQSEGFGLASIVDYYSGSAQTESDEASSLLRDLLVSTNVMPITSMVFQVGVRAEGDQTLGYLLSQLPIPSFLLPQWIPYTSLSYDLGWFGSGYPYPLIGELWVFFGWWGALLFWLIGMVCAKIDARVKWGGINTRYDYVTCALYGAMLYFSFRSFHSGMRSALRPLVYLALIGIVIRYSHSRLAERNISPTIQRAH